MGAALVAGKLVSAAWLTEPWSLAPGLLHLVLVAMIGVLMSPTAVGVFGFLTRAHLDHMVAPDLARADRAADTDVQSRPDRCSTPRQRLTTGWLT